MKNINFFSYIFLSRNSSRDYKNSYEINSFDISPAAEEIIYTLDGDVSIYRLNIETNKNDTLITENDSFRFYKPRYNLNGDSIIFIRSEYPDTFNSEIWTSDIHGENKKTQTKSPLLVTEAIFSNDGNRIFYLQSSEFDSYSPISRKAAHGINIFSLDHKTKKASKISNFNAYSLSNLFEVKDSLLMFSSIMRGRKNGLYYFNLNDKTLTSSLLSTDSTYYNYNFNLSTLINEDFMLYPTNNILILLNIKNKKEVQYLLPTGKQ